MKKNRLKTHFRQIKKIKIQNFSVETLLSPKKQTWKLAVFTCLFLMYMFNPRISRKGNTCAAHCYRKGKNMQES